jgi:hypothetical protein
MIRTGTTGTTKIVVNEVFWILVLCQGDRVIPATLAALVPAHGVSRADAHKRSRREDAFAASSEVARYQLEARCASVTHEQEFTVTPDRHGGA